MKLSQIIISSQLECVLVTIYTTYQAITSNTSVNAQSYINNLPELLTLTGSLSDTKELDQASECLELTPLTIL